MYITVKFFKESGKLSHEESIFPGIPEPAVWDTDKIVKIIERIYSPESNYVFEAIDNPNNLYNCRLVLKS